MKPTINMTKSEKQPLLPQTMPSVKDDFRYSHPPSCLYCGPHIDGNDDPPLRGDEMLVSPFSVRKWFLMADAVFSTLLAFAVFTMYDDDVIFGFGVAGLCIARMFNLSQWVHIPTTRFKNNAVIAFTVLMMLVVIAVGAMYLYLYLTDGLPPSEMVPRMMVLQVACFVTGVVLSLLVICAACTARIYENTTRVIPPSRNLLTCGFEMTDPRDFHGGSEYYDFHTAPFWLVLVHYISDLGITVSLGMTAAFARDISLILTAVVVVGMVIMRTVLISKNFFANGHSDTLRHSVVTTLLSMIVSGMIGLILWLHYQVWNEPRFNLLIWGLVVLVASLLILSAATFYSYMVLPRPKPLPNQAPKRRGDYTRI
ncbi:hypothetical protein KHV-MN_00038 [Cyprinid herpesvirus 3]|nr:hypothetical protein KHV-MN_00038 [Cyprinid herpesvirus 3]